MPRQEAKKEGGESVPGIVEDACGKDGIPFAKIKENSTKRLMIGHRADISAGDEYYAPKRSWRWY